MENKRAANYSKILNKHHLKVQVCIEKKKRKKKESERRGKTTGGKSKREREGENNVLVH